MKSQTFNEANFWQHHQKFLKRPLATESIHPLTTSLSTLCTNDLARAWDVFHQVELDAIKQLHNYVADIELLATAIQQALTNGNKIYLVGCGSSGRLGMLLKRQYQAIFGIDAIVCVSAGGYISIIRSVEQFEDSKQLGVTQLLSQGYTSSDLVIGISAAGSAQFVIGAVEYAAQQSTHNPWLVCNNDVESLTANDETHILNHPRVNLLALVIGAQALTGSSRLQATSVMQIALGMALGIAPNEHLTMPQQLSYISQIMSELNIQNMCPFSVEETNIVQNQEFILYQTDNILLGLGILADLTERAPTFNLIPFENMSDTRPLQISACYFNLLNNHNPHEVWQKLFGEVPFCLNESSLVTTSAYINGFDLSDTSNRVKATYLPQTQHNFIWTQTDKHLSIRLNDLHSTFVVPKDLFYRGLIYKLLLNGHSTLIMGRLGYFTNNLMLSVTPSNFKLVDRAIRTSLMLLTNEHKLDISYAEVAKRVFMQMQNLTNNQSIVRNVVTQILANYPK